MHIIEDSSVFNHSYIREEVLESLNRCRPIPDFEKLTKYMTQENMKEAYNKYTSANILDINKILSFKNKPDHFRDIDAKFYIPQCENMTPIKKLDNMNQKIENGMYEDYSDWDSTSTSLVIGSYEHVGSIYENCKPNTIKQQIKRMSKKQRKTFKKFLKIKNSKGIQNNIHNTSGYSSDNVTNTSLNNVSFTSKDISYYSYTSYLKNHQSIKSAMATSQQISNSNSNSNSIERSGGSSSNSSALETGATLRIGSVDIMNMSIPKNKNSGGRLLHCQSVPVECMQNKSIVAQKEEPKEEDQCVENIEMHVNNNTDAQLKIKVKSMKTTTTKNPMKDIEHATNNNGNGKERNFIVTKDALISAISKLKPINVKNQTNNINSNSALTLTSSILSKTLNNDQGQRQEEKSIYEKKKENLKASISYGNNNNNNNGYLTRFPTMNEIHHAICKEIKSGVKLRKVDKNMIKRSSKIDVIANGNGHDDQYSEMELDGTGGDFVKRIQAIKASVELNRNTFSSDTD